MNNSFKIANSIGFINDDLISDADEIIEIKAASKKPVYLRYAAAAAACLCVAGGAAVIAKTRTAPGPVLSSSVVDGENSADQRTDTGLNSSAPVTEVTLIKMSGIGFNEMPSLETGGARKYYDPEKYDTVSWNKQDLIEYFGKELTPAYIPAGLTPSIGNDTSSVIMEKGGSIALDTAWISYYHDFYEDGSPKLTENIAATKGFTINASKLGMPFQCGILVPQGDMKTTDINGTEVFFGHRSMPYGPFDPETHEPSGYYDIYVAEFELDGISYHITTDQLEADEIVKIVSSVICGEKFGIVE